MSHSTPIAGDFLSLLAEHQLASARVDSASASVVQTQATTVFAFHFAGGVLMAGDRRATAGNVIVTDRVEKIIEIDSTSLLAVAGVPATAFEMARVLQTSFEYYRRSQLQPLSLPARVRALARLLRDNLPMTMQGIGIVVPLFAGVDHAASPPQAADLLLRSAGRAISGGGLRRLRLRFRHHSQHSQFPGTFRPAPALADEFAGGSALRFALLSPPRNSIPPPAASTRPRIRYATIKILKTDWR